VVLASFAHAGLSNGSFQSGAGTLADDWTLTGSSSLALTDTDYIVNAGASGASPYGGRFLSFNAADDAADNTASQWFNTTVGTSYLLSFAFANYGVSLTQVLNVSVQDSGSNTLTGFSLIDGSGGTDLGTIWNETSLVFTATTSTTLLTFTDAGSATPSTDLFVDNVAVTPVPEPATLAVLGLGLAAIRRRRSGK